MDSICCFKLLFIISILVVTGIAKPYDVVSILSRVPENQRIDFLKHHLQLGYELAGHNSKVNKIQLSDFPELPKDFSVALYEYTRKEYGIQDHELAILLSNTICFPNGVCIDVGDVGSHPRNISTE